MSNAAFIDGNGNVTGVVVVPTNATICPTDGLPIALQGVNVTLGAPQYVMTNYAGTYRGKYAGIGDTYNPITDTFISPTGNITLIANNISSNMTSNTTI